MQHRNAVTLYIAISVQDGAVRQRYVHLRCSMNRPLEVKVNQLTLTSKGLGQSVESEKYTCQNGHITLSLNSSLLQIVITLISVKNVSHKIDGCFFLLYDYRSEKTQVLSNDLREVRTV